jgi:AraC-like DNA-binding protein
MYHETHSSKDFAEKLNISPDHLNKSIKLLTGKTAKELIQSKVSTEAKRLLYFSDLSNKEIAFQLGFREPSHFSTFFKKCTGQSPSEYRKKH